MGESRQHEFIGITLIAAVVFLIDSFLLGENVLAWIVAVIFVLLNILEAAKHTPHDWPQVRHNLAKAAVYGLMVAGVYSVNKWNEGVTQDNLAQLVAANRNYLTKYMHYPEKLEELIPEFIPAIPPAKKNYSPWNAFSYEGHVITWVSSPAARIIFWTTNSNHGKSYFNLETGQWGAY